jgi:hypothetical protein
MNCDKYCKHLSFMQMRITTKWRMPRHTVYATSVIWWWDEAACCEVCSGCSGDVTFCLEGKVQKCYQCVTDSVTEGSMRSLPRCKRRAAHMRTTCWLSQLLWPLTRYTHNSTWPNTCASSHCTNFIFIFINTWVTRGLMLSVHVRYHTPVRPRHWKLGSELSRSRICLRSSGYRTNLHAMVALGGERYSSYSFSTSALDGGEWSASAPAALLPPGKGPPVPIVQEAGWAPEPVWTQRLEEKS